MGYPDYVVVLELANCIEIAPSLYLMTAISHECGEVRLVSLRLVGTKKKWGKAPILLGETAPYSGDALNLQNLGRFLAEIVVAVVEQQFDDIPQILVRAFKEKVVCQGDPEKWGASLFNLVTPVEITVWHRHVVCQYPKIVRYLNSKRMRSQPEQTSQESKPEDVSIN